MPTLVQEAAGRIRAQGGRMTIQRRRIIETLEALESLPTAEVVHQETLKTEPGIHLSTVYRTLRWMKREGLITSFPSPQTCRKERYERVFPLKKHHFLCRSCGTVLDFTSQLTETVKTGFGTQYNAVVESASFALFGVCSECRQQEPENIAGVTDEKD